MSLSEIAALAVEEQAEKDAVLWLWTTNAHLEHSFAIVRAWGFDPKTILTWAKDRMGLGDWLRGQTEHCIVGGRGRPLLTLTNETTLLRAPRTEYSRKPDAFYELVERLSPGPWLELFARRRRFGWHVWGNEAPEVATSQAVMDWDVPA
jgi:N6-adenosine-specific RNA methylase IME4